MLRYYSYYSVGGYKDFYLGSNTDQFEASYYLSLLPVWEKRAQEKDDSELQKKVDELKKLPSIKVMDEKFQEKKFTASITAKAQPAMIRGWGFFFIFFSIFRATLKISRPTPILMPRKALAIQTISRKLSRNMEIA